MKYLLPLLLLVGCATPEERAERDIQAFGPYCDKLGYAQNSDAWRTCIQQQSAENRAQRRAATAQGQATGAVMRDAYKKSQ